MAELPSARTVRDHCRECGSDIRRWDLAGRWAYACETCQPPTIETG